MPSPIKMSTIRKHTLRSFVNTVKLNLVSDSLSHMKQTAHSSPSLASIVSRLLNSKTMRNIPATVVPKLGNATCATIMFV